MRQRRLSRPVACGRIAASAPLVSSLQNNDHDPSRDATGDRVSMRITCVRNRKKRPGEIFCFIFCLLLERKSVTSAPEVCPATSSSAINAAQADMATVSFKSCLGQLSFQGTTFRVAQTECTGEWVEGFNPFIRASVWTGDSHGFHDVKQPGCNK